jgi:hypothetical protein
MERGRTSIHIAIRLKVRCVLRTAGFASDKRENVQNRGNAADVSRNAHEPISHVGMFVSKDFNMFARSSADLFPAEDLRRRH